MNYIEIDGQGYLVFEDSQLGERYIVEATKPHTKISEMTRFEKEVFEEMYKDEE